MTVARSSRRLVRRAAAVVEFAIIAPVFFTLILGIIEFGRMIMVQEILVNAARVSARQAILSGETDAQVQSTLSSYMSGAGISGYSYTISPDLSTSPSSGTAITVTVSVPCSSVSWTGFLTYFNGKTLSSSVVMIHE